jgi:hypothetical protein
MWHDSLKFNLMCIVVNISTLNINSCTGASSHAKEPNNNMPVHYGIFFDLLFNRVSINKEDLTRKHPHRASPKIQKIRSRDGVHSDVC